MATFSPTPLGILQFWRYASTTSQTNDDISKLNEQILTASSQSEDLSGYTIGTGDLIEAAVFEAEQLNTAHFQHPKWSKLNQFYSMEFQTVKNLSNWNYHNILISQTISKLT